MRTSKNGISSCRPANLAAISLAPICRLARNRRRYPGLRAAPWADLRPSRWDSGRTKNQEKKKPPDNEGSQGGEGHDIVPGAIGLGRDLASLLGSLGSGQRGEKVFTKVRQPPCLCPSRSAESWLQVRTRLPSRSTRCMGDPWMDDPPQQKTSVSRSTMHPCRVGGRICQSSGRVKVAFREFFFPRFFGKTSLMQAGFLRSAIRAAERFRCRADDFKVHEMSPTESCTASGFCRTFLAQTRVP